MPWIADVNPNELIESAWGNTIRDHVVNTFATIGDRDAAIPAPADGQVCYLQDNNALQVREDAAWHTLPRGHLNAAETSISSGVAGSAPVIVPGLSTIGFAVAANRILRIDASMTVLQQGAASLIRMYIREGAADLLVGLQPSQIGGYYTVGMSRLWRPAAGYHIIDTYLSTDVGSATVEGGTGVVSTVAVSDIGGT